MSPWMSHSARNVWNVEGFVKPHPRGWWHLTGPTLHQSTSMLREYGPCWMFCVRLYRGTYTSRIESRGVGRGVVRWSRVHVGAVVGMVREHLRAVLDKSRRGYPTNKLSDYPETGWRDF